MVPLEPMATRQLTRRLENIAAWLNCRLQRELCRRAETPQANQIT
jgi:hypothetical protein